MKFYYAESSPPCRTIILLADLLDIQLELITISPKNGETKTSEFLQMNPQHVVPTLVDNEGYIVWESRAIAKYLVGKYASNDLLYPSEFYKRLEVDKILDFDLGTLFRRATDYIIPFLATGKIDASKKPKLDDAMNVLNSILKRSSSGFVAGDNLTIADISILTITSTLEIFGYDLSALNSIVVWMEKIKSALPNYETLGKKGEDAFRTMIDASKK